MNFDTIETEVVQALSGILVAAITASLAWVSNHVKAYLAAHTDAKIAETASNAVDKLQQIAEAVVEDFNQKIVADAKANGVWNKNLADTVRKEALQAVLDQGAAFAGVLKSAGTDVEGLVLSFINSYVRAHHIETVTSSAAESTGDPVQTSAETQAQTGQATA
ncbi:hypothetical protein [Alicyclobacillus contaminans]|uniref:hypothetical protein n=1 Tax=Alicyclobacillus contaminans TaxID=392016 RepID=UPI000478A8AD|nr:hypothetical protein [Alicyclobacillus contaminans]